MYICHHTVYNIYIVLCTSTYTSTAHIHIYAYDARIYTYNYYKYIHNIKYVRTCIYVGEITLPRIPTVILSTFPFTGICVLLKYIIVCVVGTHEIIYYII